MGRPPKFISSKGAYNLSPGPAAYPIRQPADVLDTLYAEHIFGRSKSISKSPKRRMDQSYESYQKGYGNHNFATLKNNFNPTSTLSNFIYKESGSRFGSSSRVPLDIRETIPFPGPGTYAIKDKLVYPKCKNVSFGSNSRAAEFLATGSVSPGPARYKQNPLIGKVAYSPVHIKPVKHILAKTLVKTLKKRSESVFAANGHKNILQF
jgi:hypothetical protein